MTVSARAICDKKNGKYNWERCKECEALHLVRSLDWDVAGRVESRRRERKRAAESEGGWQGGDVGNQGRDGREWPGKT